MPIQKVLVVDDSKTELMFLTDLLQKKGMQVRTAILEKDDGTLTGNIQEMVGQFRKQRLRYFRPYEPDQSPVGKISDRNSVRH